MKTKLNSLLLTATGLTLSVAAAYGQTKVVADVPFAFRTAAGVQNAGQYLISQEGAATKLVNRETGRASLLGIGTPQDANSNAAPQLVFLCGSETGCALRSVTIADGRTYSYKTPRLNPSETARVTVIHFESRQAE
jgi:hypothetical protein